MGPNANLSYLLHHLAAVIDKQSDQILQEHLGIGLSQYRILMVLEWSPRLQQKAIADSLGQTEASISRQIKLMIKSSLITTQPDRANRRKHIALPTPKGMQLTEAANALLRRSFSQEAAQLGDDQQLQLSAALHKLHRLICKPGRTGACDHQLGF